VVIVVIAVIEVIEVIGGDRSVVIDRRSIAADWHDWR